MQVAAKHLTPWNPRLKIHELNLLQCYNGYNNIWSFNFSQRGTGTSWATPCISILLTSASVASCEAWRRTFTYCICRLTIPKSKRSTAWTFLKKLNNLKQSPQKGLGWLLYPYPTGETATQRDWRASSARRCIALRNSIITKKRWTILNSRS